MLYQVALFVHIGGALILFIAIGMQISALRGLGRARTVEQARVWLQVARGTDRLFPLGGALLLLAGVYMTLTVWGIWVAWIDVALVALITLSALGPLVNARRFRAIARTAAAVDSNAITADMRRRVSDPTLRTSVYAMSGAALGIVFLMTIKPELPGALATMALAVVVGGLFALTTRQRATVAVPAPARAEGAEVV